MTKLTRNDLFEIVAHLSIVVALIGAVAIS